MSDLVQFEAGTLTPEMVLKAIEERDALRSENEALIGQLRYMASIIDESAISYGEKCAAVRAQIESAINDAALGEQRETEE